MQQSQEKLGLLKQDWEKELLKELIQDVESELKELSLSQQRVTLRDRNLVLQKEADCRTRLD